MSRAFIPRMGGAPAHMSRDPDAVQRWLAANPQDQ